ncbi:FmdB family transcriptional regulator [Mycolicibacter terrae]|uniref:FmdB family transcriptional regulator n=1 Tax=Mycolicibacter terrae TaxID=1788 RepID=A0AAD1MJ16_9MYCO|nr:FmdB family zinc ribbon protein [Mycolicibacter terrae]ORW88637.1 FmdB family transcriptional regulator [Mycolicibacter terrae]BBX23725.1 FmdB family transcriptional regulator [Mycolicibacter terrae]SNV60555.1 FmdB family regulatory protein [Mycolicibacter terrae]
MPTYSYACTECSNRFDVVQAFTDDALTTCEECNGRLRKIFGKVGVVFKGSGFYRTDSRDAGKTSTNGGGSAKSTASDSGSGGSGDGGTKSADKSSADSGTKSADKPKTGAASTPAAASA